MTKISVIMVSFHTGPSLLEAIDAVLADSAIAELILVDNGNDVAARRQYFNRVQNDPRVRIAQGHGNIGFGRACNLGAKLASGDCLLFLNPDAILETGAATKMLNAGEGLSEPWIIGGLLTDENGREQRGSRRGVLTPRTLFGGFNQNGQPLPDSPVPQATISGACFMMSAAGFAQIGGFDPRYFLHVEDIDLCRRARLAGGDVFIAPKARARHYGATSKASSAFVTWEKYKSFLRYFWTYKPGLGSKLITLILAGPLALVLALRMFRS